MRSSLQIDRTAHKTVQPPCVVRCVLSSVYDSSSVAAVLYSSSSIIFYFSIIKSKQLKRQCKNRAAKKP